MKTCPYGAWVSPDGVLYEMTKYGGHIDFAASINKLEKELEDEGWCKIMTFHEGIIAPNGCNQKQIDTLFDFYIENDYDTISLKEAIEKDYWKILL